MTDTKDQILRQLRIGWISYWNLMPLGKELSKLKYGKIEQVSGHPTQVNQWLRDGKVNLAPCSSINLIHDPRSEIAIPAGVSSDGTVKSVYLGFTRNHEELFGHIKERQIALRDIVRTARQKFGNDNRKISNYVWSLALELPQIPLSKAPTIKFSNSSATSVALSKVLYKLWFGNDAYEVNCIRTSQMPTPSKSAIELVIGDSALERKCTFYKTYDLGLAWKEMTGLPFVFAVWQSMGESINGWRRAIMEAAELAETKMKVEPAQYLPTMLPQDDQGNSINLSKYWECINYKLGPDEFKGLLLYLNLAKDLKPEVMRNEKNIIKLTRWQELSKSNIIIH